MKSVEENVILVLDFIPELMALLNAFSALRLQIHQVWGEEVAKISYRCPTCNTVVRFINEDNNARKYYCRECGGQVPSDQLQVKLRRLIKSPEDPQPIQQEFLFEVLSLWQGYQLKGIPVEKLFTEITQNLQLFAVERKVQTLFEREPRQKQAVPEEEFEEVRTAFVQHKILAPTLEGEATEFSGQAGSFNRWMDEQKDYLYRVFADIIARYIIWLDNSNTGGTITSKWGSKKGKDVFLLLTIRDFIADVKAYSYALHREGLPLEKAWRDLSRNLVGPLMDPLELGSDSTEFESNQLHEDYLRILERIQRIYERIGFDIGKIYHDITEELEFMNIISPQEALMAEIIPLRQYFNEETSFEEFMRKVIVKELAHFIALLAEETTANSCLRATFGDAHLCNLHWQFIGDFLALIFEYHHRGLRDIKTHWGNAIRYNSESVDDLEASMDWDSVLEQKFISDIQALSHEYQQLELQIDSIWRAAADELKLLDELEREDILLSGTTHFKTPLLERRFRTEKLIKGRCWERLGFSIANILYDIDNIGPEPIELFMDNSTERDPFRNGEPIRRGE